MMETVDGGLLQHRGIGWWLGDKRRIQASSVVLHRWSEIIQCVIRRSRSCAEADVVVKYT